MSGGAPSAESLRIDRLLVYLRFVRTRTAAQAIIESGHVRVNSERVTKSSLEVAVGDVLTVPLGSEIRVARVERIPSRRLSPAQAARAWSRLA